MTDNQDKPKNLDVNKIFEASPCLTLDELFDYSNEKLSEDECFRVEHHLLDCELCSLTLDNLAAAGDQATIAANVAEINREIGQLAKAEKQQQDVKKVLLGTAILAALQRSMSYRHVRYSGIALAGLLVLAVSVLTFNAFQKPAFHEIPIDNGQVRGSAYQFFDDSAALSNTDPANRHFLNAAAFVQELKYDQAIGQLKSAAGLYGDAENWAMYVRCYNAMAEYSRILGEHAAARTYIDESLNSGLEKLGAEHPEISISKRISSTIP